jgi:uncharacterized phiE125 gp8 family phage protein
MLLRRITPAASLPIALGEARDHLNEPPVEHDVLIAGFIATACDMIAEMSGRVLAQETWAASWPAISGDLVLPKSPVIGVTSITYYDLTDTLQTANLADFYVFQDQDRSIVRPKARKLWPTGIIREDAITVTFTAGYASVPPALRTAAMMLIGHLYDNREAVVTGTITATLPLAVEEMVGLHRVGWIAA